MAGQGGIEAWDVLLCPAGAAPEAAAAGKGEEDDVGGSGEVEEVEEVEVEEEEEEVEVVVEYVDDLPLQSPPLASPPPQTPLLPSPPLPPPSPPPLPPLPPPPAPPPHPMDGAPVNGVNASNLDRITDGLAAFLSPPPSPPLPDLPPPASPPLPLSPSLPSPPSPAADACEVQEVLDMIAGAMGCGGGLSERDPRVVPCRNLEQRGRAAGCRQVAPPSPPPPSPPPSPPPWMTWGAISTRLSTASTSLSTSPSPSPAPAAGAGEAFDPATVDPCEVQAWGSFITRTRPTLYHLLLLRLLCVRIHPEGEACSDLGRVLVVNDPPARRYWTCWPRPSGAAVA